MAIVTRLVVVDINTVLALLSPLPPMVEKDVRQLREVVHAILDIVQLTV